MPRNIEHMVDPGLRMTARPNRAGAIFYYLLLPTICPHLPTILDDLA